MKKNNFTNVLLIIVFLAGLSLLLYPSVANYWNSIHQSKAITDYAHSVGSVDSDRYDAYLEAARVYNSHIPKRIKVYALSTSEREDYENLLNIDGTGVMGYIEIPSIDVKLPIYHGTSDVVLQVAAGHLDWTSLPVGGEGTHCVLSGHRGLPSAKLFTHLDRLVVGDLFMIRVLDEVLTYEVDQILIVEPDDTRALQIVPGEDYCTLVTCTPYGINTHRLLVRGHRTENSVLALSVHITAEAVQIEPRLVAFVIGIPVLIIFMIAALLTGRKKKRKTAERK